MSVSLFANVSDPFYQCIALFGLFIILFGLISLFIKERLYLTESLVAVIIGILSGPLFWGILKPTEWFSTPGTFSRVLMEFSRIIISFQVMAVGLSLPGVYVKKHWRDILMFLGPIMFLMWLVSSLAVYAFSGLDILTSLMIGACLAPTDPVLANAVIKGKKFANRYIPSHLRNLLSVESGANDGLGFPFLMLPICLKLSDTVGEALQTWFLRTWLYEIFFSIVIGGLVGITAKYLLEQSEKRKLIDKDSFLVYSLAIALSITGLVALISSDDLLAVFIAGNVFAYDDKYQQATKDANIQEVIDMLFNCIYFVFMGAIFPWNDYREMGIWTLVLISGCVLLFRRLPFVMILRPLIPQLKSQREAFFAGWFGPMGVGAIFFAMVCKHHDGIDEATSKAVFTVVSFVVLSSVIIHGITVPITHVHLKTRARRKAKMESKRSAINYGSDPMGLSEQQSQPLQLRDIPGDLESGKVWSPQTGKEESDYFSTDTDSKFDKRKYFDRRIDPDLTESDAHVPDYSSTTTAAEDSVDGRALRKEQILARLRNAHGETSNSQYNISHESFDD